VGPGAGLEVLEKRNISVNVLEKRNISVNMNIHLNMYICKFHSNCYLIIKRKIIGVILEGKANGV
jgi:hypothetical protein